MMGAGVGLTIGFIFGSYSILRYALCFNLSDAATQCSLFNFWHAQARSRPQRAPGNALPIHVKQRSDILLLPCDRLGAKFSLLA